MAGGITIKDDNIPRMRLAELQFRLELLEAAVNRIADWLDAEDEKRRRREAWDGRS